MRQAYALGPSGAGSRDVPGASRALGRAPFPPPFPPPAGRQPTGPARYTFVGQCFGDRSHQGGWQRPDGAEKVV
ncbi:glycosyl transferase, partial [Kitasatospora sp. NPDC001574]